MALTKATARARRIMDVALPATHKQRIAVSRKLNMYETEVKQGPELHVPSKSFPFLLDNFYYVKRCERTIKYVRALYK